MTHRGSWLIAAVWELISGVAAGQATPDAQRPQVPPAAPLFTGKPLPAPPEQGKAWTLHSFRSRVTPHDGAACEHRRQQGQESGAAVR